MTIVTLFCCLIGDNKELKAKIRSNMAKIVSEIDVTGYILDELTAMRFLSYECRKEIEQQSTRPKRARALIEKLLTSSHPTACEAFADALEKDYGWLVKTLFRN